MPGDEIRRLIVIPQRQRHVDCAAGRCDVGLSSRLYSGKTYRTLREAAKQLGNHLPKIIATAPIGRRISPAAHDGRRHAVLRSSASTMLARSTATSRPSSVPVLKNVRDMETGPILVHVVTQKGKGYGPAEACRQVSRVVKFDVATGAQAKAQAERPLLIKTCSRELVKEAEKDDKIVGITAAMRQAPLDILRQGLPSPALFAMSAVGRSSMR